MISIRPVLNRFSIQLRNYNSLTAKSYKLSLPFKSSHQIHRMISSTTKKNLHHDITENVWKPETVIPDNIKKLLNPSNPKFKINYILAFIQIVRLLKTQKRTGWIDRGIPSEKTESIADHMYRMSIISLIIPNSENKISIDKCVKIAAVHDIAESLVGDITPFGGVTKQEKHRRELITIEYLSSLIEPYNPQASKEIMELWLDYEEIRCLEAQYVKDIDKFEMIQQAWDYEQEYGLKYDLSEFYDSRKAIKTIEIGELCDEVLSQRNLFINELKDNQS